MDVLQYAECVLSQDDDGAIKKEMRYEAIALWLKPMKRTDKLGDTSPGSPGWKRPMTPCFFSPVRSRRISVVSALTVRGYFWFARDTTRFGDKYQ